MPHITFYFVILFCTMQTISQTNSKKGIDLDVDSEVLSIGF